MVLFPFDDRSIPFTYGLSYNLVQGRRRGVVLRPAESGPDSQHIINHGSVLRVDGEFRIWYLCSGDHDPSVRDLDDPGPPSLDDDYNPRKVDDERIYHVCYAVSQDGLHWDRPALGLVDYGGNKQNNLIAFDLGEYRVTNLRIIRDPEEPNPQRRFKMAFQSGKYRSRLAMAASPDGLTWKEMPGNPHNTVMLEISGFTKFNGAYYVNGHGGSPRPGPAAHAPRRMVTYVSYDFEHWASATALSFERKLGDVPVPWKGNSGEQIHTGAALWNRGNVVIGFYGMWHGDMSDDRRMTAIDLGMIVSDDAIHFREPITDFRIVAANEEGETETPLRVARLNTKGGGSLYGALMQGQGWENVGDHTLYWYNVWTQGRVRLATWARDRLGYFEIVRQPREQADRERALHLVPDRADWSRPEGVRQRRRALRPELPDGRNLRRSASTRARLLGRGVRTGQGVRIPPSRSMGVEDHSRRGGPPDPGARQFRR